MLNHHEPPISDGNWAGELFELAAGTSSVKREGASMLDTEARIAVLVKQMAAAIRYIHSMGIVHRDIKFPDPKNSAVETQNIDRCCKQKNMNYMNYCRH